MSYEGDFTTANTIYVYFGTYDSNDPSASVVVSDFVVGDIVIYKNGSVTQRTSTNGFTLLDTDGIDFDGIVGIHGFSIDLSDDTDVGFYAAGGEYMIKVGPVTIDAATVNLKAATFSIERTGGAIALLKGTNSLANIEDKIDIIDTNVDQIETAVITNAAGVDISADILTIDNFVDNLEARVPDTISLANINAEVDTAIVDANLDHVVIATFAVETDGSNSTTQVRTNLAEATDDHYNRMMVLFTSGAEAGQSRRILDYVGLTGIVSWNRALTGTPADTVTGVILPFHDEVDLLAATQTSLDAIETDTSTTLDNLVDDLETRVPDTISLANINAEVDTALNTAIPGGPTANSINQRVLAIDDLTQAGGSGDLAAMLTDTSTTLDDLVDDLESRIPATFSENSQGLPPITPTLVEAIMYLYMNWRNASTTTATVRSTKNNAGTTICDATMSDNSTTFDQGIMTTGA